MFLMNIYNYEDLKGGSTMNNVSTTSNPIASKIDFALELVFLEPASAFIG